jgi:hypothetical protein
MTFAIDKVLIALQKSRFRASFHLKGNEFKIAAEKGSDVIRQHACELLENRLFVADPVKDGKQTPFKGHPVFVAQHATATCCRRCLQKWHHIPKGRELTTNEQSYVVEVIVAWISRELGSG